MAEATVCAIGLRWQANVEAVAFDRAGATAADNLPGPRSGFSRRRTASPARPSPLRRSASPTGSTSRLGFLEMTVADDGGVRRRSRSRTSRWRRCPTLRRCCSASHPPAVPTMAPTSSSSFAARSRATGRSKRR